MTNPLYTAEDFLKRAYGNTESEMLTTFCNTKHEAECAYKFQFNLEKEVSTSVSNTNDNLHYEIRSLRTQLDQGKQLHEADEKCIKELKDKLDEAIKLIKFYAEPFTWSRVMADARHVDYSEKSPLLNNMYGQKAREFLEKVGK